MIRPLILLSLSLSALATSQFNTMDSVEIIEIVEAKDGSIREKVISKEVLKKSNLEFYSEMFQDPKEVITLQSVGDVIKTASDVVGLGKEIYDLVKLGKPVVNLDAAPISVLPMNLDKSPVGALELNNWKEPIVKKYRLSVKNYLGVTAVDFRWKIVFHYGGEYNEKGAFITGALIKPEFVDVMFGYELNVSYKLQSIANIGSKENPVAQAVIDLDYSYETMFQKTIRSNSYLINGLGSLKSI